MDLSKKPVDGVHADNKGYEHNGESNGTKFDLGSEGKSDVSPEEPPPKGEDGMIYNISERPPIVLAGFFGLQQALLSLSGNLSVSLLVAETVCAEEDEEFKARLLGTTLFMSGITTLLMTFFGARLPLFQGAAPDYVIPLLAMAAINKDQCTPDAQTVALARNASLLNGEEFDLIAFNRPTVLHNTQLLQGSLIAAGAIHCIIGLTGLVGFLLRFVGPITIVPAIFLIGIYLMKATAKFAKVHWGISFMTCAISLILALYLSRVKLPVPMYTRRKGWHSIRYPYHQTFAILIAIIVGWAVCGILTATDAIEYNKNATDFYTRTDARSYIIASSNWFFWPYPGQFGAIDFSVSVFIGFLIATFTSILDSIGDYYACASMCRVPPPPSHAVNRGIAMEGFCSLIAGLLGCGHATTTYGGNIGAIGVTRVSSRLVFFFCGVIYLVFGIIGKFSAVFICIPYPVLGGALITMYGMFTGVVLSNLQAVDLSSSRNLAIIGTSIFTGLMVPHWIETFPDEIQTGNDKADEVLKIILGNPNMFGGVLACILDNTVPGTVEERGIAVWQKVQETGTDSGYVEGYDIYNVWLPKAVRRSRLVRFLPFLQNPHDGPIPRTLTDELRDAIGPDSTKL
ncbi:solute carrier family 23 member 2-like isoform X2 [Mya arenaria]|nr:solute carrier family 23 member 2-like isoform X2 [Mya arenaria]XP_052772556.1 solute carrier family 23 member 2-like isoform X2 [Mya arenaria]XP_052772557.1 solute carrier family 23 member 2-like isoform X2 [Mya arenaria]XP_052772558.1 solute carrier family 23 member 2-like isoform X2 [Mya arenaria]